VRAEAGEIDASGKDITPSRTDTRLWLAAGGLGRLRYVVWSPFFVELTAGIRFALLRSRFFFEPNSTAFEVPVLSGFAGGTIGFTIL